MVLEVLEHIKTIFEFVTLELPGVHSNFCDILLILDHFLAESNTNLLVVMRDTHVENLDSLVSGWHCELLQSLVSLIVMNRDDLLFLLGSLSSVLQAVLSHHILTQSLQIGAHGALHIVFAECNFEVVVGLPDPD